MKAKNKKKSIKIEDSVLAGGGGASSENVVESMKSKKEYIKNGNNIQHNEQRDDRHDGIINDLFRYFMYGYRTSSSNSGYLDGGDNNDGK